MATPMNGFGGDASRVIEALQRFQDDPEGLAQERRRYSESPPPCPSGDTTRPSSPAPPLSEADRRIQRELDRLQSCPYHQDKNQWHKEGDRILEQIERRRERRKETLPYIRGVSYDINADNNIRNNWIEQGIWNHAWTSLPFGSWTGYPFGPFKHEERLEVETKSLPEQLTIRARAAAASRPCPQFKYQIAKECEWLEDDFWTPGLTGPVDIEAMAYENVKRSWTEQKIWNPRWGDEPGMVWMHEEPDGDEHDIAPVPEVVPSDEQDFADNVQPALRRILAQVPSGLSLAQGSDVSDVDRNRGHFPVASGGSDVPFLSNQLEAASSPARIDSLEVSSSAMNHKSGRVKKQVIPTTNNATAPAISTPLTESLFGSAEACTTKSCVEGRTKTARVLVTGAASKRQD